MMSHHMELDLIILVGFGWLIHQQGNCFPKNENINIEKNLELDTTQHGNFEFGKESK